MKIEIMIAVLGIICIGSLAAFFVAWAKADEWKKTAADEHANYLAALNLHNTTAEQFGIEQRYLESKINFEDGYHKYAIKEEIERRVCAEAERDELQDRLSALLCPSNNHIWEDGVCVKCGRMQDD